MGDGEDSYQVLATGITGRNYDDVSAKANTNYSYRIQGVFKGAQTQYGEKSGIAPIIQETLGVPKMVGGSALYYTDEERWGGFSIWWQEVDNAAMYEVRWRKQGESQWESGTTNETDYSPDYEYNEAVAKFGDYYETQVRALDKTTEHGGDWSKIVTFRIEPWGVDNFHVQSRTDTSAELRWTQDEYSHYGNIRIYRQFENGARTLIATLDGDATSYVDSNLTPGYYRYWATNVSQGLESSFEEPEDVVVGNPQKKEPQIMNIVWGYRNNGKGIWFDYPDIINVDDYDYNYWSRYEIYDANGSIVLDGKIENRYVTNYITISQNGSYGLRLFVDVECYDGDKGDWVTEYTIQSDIIRFTISDLDQKPLTVQKPQAKLYDNNRGFVVYKPGISGGSGNYTITYYLYDDNFTLYGTKVNGTDSCGMDCPDNGLYTVNVVVTDNVTGESIQVNAGWYVINGFYKPLAVQKPDVTLGSDARGFIVSKPTITGGSGQYAMTYYLYDIAFNPLAIYPYDVPQCYMGCPENGAYVSVVVVTDLVTGESQSVATDWVAVTGYYAPLTAENPTGSLYSDGKGFTVNKPVASGGSGSYSYAYYLYDSNFTLQGACPYDGDVFYMNCPANGLYTANVYVMDNVTGEGVWVNAGWYNITGYYAPLTVEKPNAVISGDARGFLVFKPTITGGSGQYAITYCLYDSSFTQHAAYPYDVEVCYMGCPTNGAYVSTVFVTDLVTGETVAVSTDWFGITGY